MKSCFKCGERKPLSEFYAHPQMRDGRLNKCKVCARRDVRDHRARSDSVREYDRRRWRQDPSRRADNARRNRKRTAQFPQKAKANRAVGNAIRDGRLHRPEFCSECRTPCVPHGHHDDYAKPLDVRWLCVRCHARHHAKERMVER